MANALKVNTGVLGATSLTFQRIKLHFSVVEYNDTISSVIIYLCTKFFIIFHN